jgi:hypothetical protein
MAEAHRGISSGGRGTLLGIIGVYSSCVYVMTCCYCCRWCYRGCWGVTHERLCCRLLRVQQGIWGHFAEVLEAHMIVVTEVFVPKCTVEQS